MKKSARLACVIVTVVALLAPAAPAFAEEVCDQLPDLTGYGWQWPC